MKSHKLFDYEQIDLFSEDNHEDLNDSGFNKNYFDPWDVTRGRNIIKAQGKNGQNITLYYDALDQQYHLFDE